jgi:hypothetical protein
MRHVWNCRRTFLALSCILVLGVLGYLKGAEVAMSMSTIVIGVAGANAYEKKGQVE